MVKHKSHILHLILHDILHTIHDIYNNVYYLHNNQMGKGWYIQFRVRTINLYSSNIQLKRVQYRFHSYHNMVYMYYLLYLRKIHPYIQSHIRNLLRRIQRHKSNNKYHHNLYMVKYMVNSLQLNLFHNIQLGMDNHWLVF